MSTYSNKRFLSINQGHLYLRTSTCAIVLFIFQFVWKLVYLICVSSYRPWHFNFSLHHIYICIYSWIRGSKMSGVDVCLHLCLCERVGGGGWQERCWSSEAFLMSQGNQCQRRWLWWMPLRKQCVTMTSAWRCRRAKSGSALTFSRLLLWRWPFQSLAVHPNVDLSLARW